LCTCELCNCTYYTRHWCTYTRRGIVLTKIVVIRPPSCQDSRFPSRRNSRPGAGGCKPKFFPFGGQPPPPSQTTFFIRCHSKCPYAGYTLSRSPCESVYRPLSTLNSSHTVRFLNLIKFPYGVLVRMTALHPCVHVYMYI